MEHGAAPLKRRMGLDEEGVRTAYRRWARFYDRAFGGVSSKGRKEAVFQVNSLPGSDVLEVGVGTGLALPFYTPKKRVHGIDLSRDMLDLARERVKRENLQNVVGLDERNAEATGFPDNGFDIAVAMFVASVVPNPDKLFTELKRVVRPGGYILCVNHFKADKGPRLWVEKAMAPAARHLGWHPDFGIESLLTPAERQKAALKPVSPCGLFTLVSYRNDKSARPAD